MSEEQWAGLLDPDEKILWQGRPDTAFALEPGGIFKIFFFLFFAGFSMFWMWGASFAGGFFWMFGLLFFGVGSVGFLSAVFGSTLSRRHTWYTLTTKRAFIASDLPFRAKTLNSYPIDPSTQLQFETGELSTIYFASEVRRGNKSSYTVNIGFERIADGQQVYRHLRDIQIGQYQEAAP